MADEQSAVESATPQPEVSTPAPSESSTSQTISPSPASSSSGSFGENLRATAGLPAATTQTFSQADLDARLATERETWQKAQDEKWAWANGITPEQISTYRDTEAALLNSPVESVTRLLTYALSDERFRPAAMKLVSNVLAGRAAGQAAPQQHAEDPEPQPDLPATTLDGRTVMMFSADQQLKREAWLRRQMDSSFGARLKPYEDERAANARRQQEAETQRGYHAFAQQTYDAFTKLPGFAENQAAIHDVWAKMPTSDDPYQVRENLHHAYVQVVFPKLQSTAAANTAADNSRRAAANTGRPVSSHPSQPSPAAPVGMAEGIAREMAALRRKSG